MPFDAPVTKAVFPSKFKFIVLPLILPHVLGALAVQITSRDVDQRGVVVVASATAPAALTVGPVEARVDERLGLFRGFDVRSPNARDATI